MFSSMRRESWESRSKAEASIRKNPLFQTWDSRALTLFLAYGLRDLEDGTVTLTTPKAQEDWSYVHSNFLPLPEDTTTVEARNRERLVAPDFTPFSDANMLIFARGDSQHVSELLPHLRPRALFVYGASSHINNKKQREEHVAVTGIGRGGNGGATDGGVESRLVEKASHLVVFEKPAQVANEISVWMKREIDRWTQERDFWATLDTGKSVNDRRELSRKWMENVKKGAVVPRPKSKDASKL